MAEFKRGLDDTFIDLLNNNYDQPDSWWRTLVEDPDVFIGIRGNELNAYYNGCSLLRLRHRRDHLVGETHFKFLIRNQPNANYISFRDGNFDDDDLAAIEFSRDMRSDLAAIKAASKLHQGREAQGVHDVVRANFNIIDTEVVFPDEKTSRIDFAALRLGGERPELVFYEAKHFSNSELFGDYPKVVQQVERYRKLVSDQGRAREIRDSYSRIAANYAKLKGIDEKFQTLCQQVVTTGLEISKAVRLVIFGITREDQRTRRDVFDRLKNLIGKDNVLVRGDPKGIVRGISQ